MVQSIWSGVQVFPTQETKSSGRDQPSERAAVIGGALDGRPGFGFHSLKGNRKGEYALTVTANYRLTFRFEEGDVSELNLEDYH